MNQFSTAYLDVYLDISSEEQLLPMIFDNVMTSFSQ
jgi:hypothetical protein